MQVSRSSFSKTVVLHRGHLCSQTSLDQNGRRHEHVSIFRIARFHSNVRWWDLLHLKIDYKMIVLHAPCEDEVPSMVCPFGGSVSTFLVRFSASRCDPRSGPKRHKVRFIARHCRTGACSLQVSEGPSHQAFSNGSGATRSRFVGVWDQCKKPRVSAQRLGV